MVNEPSVEALGQVKAQSSLEKVVNASEGGGNESIRPLALTWVAKGVDKGKKVTEVTDSVLGAASGEGMIIIQVLMPLQKRNTSDTETVDDDSPISHFENEEGLLIEQLEKEYVEEQKHQNKEAEVPHDGFDLIFGGVGEEATYGKGMAKGVEQSTLNQQGILSRPPAISLTEENSIHLSQLGEIDRREARISAMRSAILETFPEPNRRLLQRSFLSPSPPLLFRSGILKMMYKIASHSLENRMTPSAVAACMAPLLLRPLLAGECEMEDEFDTNGDSSAQLLAAANAANNAQAIITTLLEEYENIFDEENTQRCSISADSRIENSETEESTDDDNIDVKDNGYHDAENEVDQETDDDADRVHSGKMSESSGYAGSDLYDYKAFGGDDSDVGSSNSYHAKAENAHMNADTEVKHSEDPSKQKKGNENSVDKDAPNVLSGSESYRSMGEILSSMDPSNHLSSLGNESGSGKQASKASNTNFSSKRSTFWGRGNVRRTPSVESVDSSGEEELAIQRLEIAKNDLQHRIAKEARGNAILQASLERRKQALHERRLALEQDVSRLQEQLQAERDLRAALEVGLSMSSGQFSSSRGMDSKTRAELEEIALAEADVARLKQKVAELHHQLNQQRQHHYGSLADTSDRYQHIQNPPQQRFLQQDFDTTLAFCNHERKQRTEENLLGADWRNVKGQVLASGNGSRQPSRKQFVDSASPCDSKSTEASTSVSVEDLGAVDSASFPSTSRAAEVMEYSRHPSVASSTLVELTTRLDFFKERRSQLMEQLHNLDLNYG
ncbi:rho GTPase-activating protein 7-like isoform X1 [Senna tora]|uniref:Rho GTPase-activating protein 7-like isoform X1 n=1 Tax=Senna tora TaxID=362788 RepID=A0A834WW30_9FABA|nr:rho GTPase-activating protein 7-like isoform X1 [Senna tora]